MTAAAAMQLVEQPKMDLDTPASEVCEELGNIEVLDGFDDDGEPITRPPASPATLRHLLTHTSGFVYHMWNENALKWYGVTGCPDIFSVEKVSLMAPLAFDPGTQLEYGIGID